MTYGPNTTTPESDNCAQVSVGCTICALNGVIHITDWARHEPTPGTITGQPKWAT